jgi:hypothetical protein
MAPFTDQNQANLRRITGITVMWWTAPTRRDTPAMKDKGKKKDKKK